MEIMDALINRRSIRTYTGVPVGEDQLHVLLKAAYASPVSMGQYDEVALTVVRDRRLLAAIDATAKRRFGNDHMLYGAPMFIMVSAPLVGDASDNSAYSNAATIVENLNLAAVALGLGGCHIWGVTSAIAQDAKLCERLQVPAGMTPVAGFVVGASSEGYPTRSVDMDRIQTTIL